MKDKATFYIGDEIKFQYNDEPKIMAIAIIIGFHEKGYLVKVEKNPDIKGDLYLVRKGEVINKTKYWLWRIKRLLKRYTD